MRSMWHFWLILIFALVAVYVSVVSADEPYEAHEAREASEAVDQPGDVRNLDGITLKAGEALGSETGCASQDLEIADLKKELNQADEANDFIRDKIINYSQAIDELKQQINDLNSVIYGLKVRLGER